MATPGQTPPEPSSSLIGLTPELLQKFEAALPGLGSKLVAAMEEALHRRGMEKTQLDADVELMRSQSKEITRGQIFAFLITLSFAAAGTYVIVNGHPVAGTIFGGVGLGSIVSTFIWGRSSRTNQESSDLRNQPAD